MKYSFLGLLAAMAISTTGIARAVDISVPNFSFEDSYYSNNSYTSTTGIANWIQNNADQGAYYGTQDNNGQFNNTGTVSSPVYGVFLGDQYAFLNVANGGSATLTSASPVVASIQAGTTYTLTVGIGNHLEADDGDYGQPGNQTISLLANGVVIPDATFTLQNGTLANGDNADYFVSFSTTGVDAIYDTQALTIQLGTSDAGVDAPVQAAFDDVRLTADAVPEPGTWAMMFAGAFILVGLGYRRVRA
jgi:hypothetical protein